MLQKKFFRPPRFDLKNLKQLTVLRDQQRKRVFMQNISVTFTGSPEQVATILAALTPTTQTVELSRSSTQPVATKGGKTSKPAEVETEETTDVGDAFNGEAEENELASLDYSLTDVQKMMGAYAKAKGPAAAHKMLAKFKVKKLADLSQEKLNELAGLIG